MIITIRSVRLERAGFVVSWESASGFGAVVLRPEQMPPGHEFIRTNAVVDARFGLGGTIIAVYEAPPSLWVTGRSLLV